MTPPKYNAETRTYTVKQGIAKTYAHLSTNQFVKVYRASDVIDAKGALKRFNFDLKNHLRAIN